ncbi:MAG: phosphohydrolase [Coriobacteriia bacterium]|nr:phosphohydrolase [Coriobacteriia bacterium]
MNKCPGADLRSITAEDLTCPSCGARVELFSDEQKRRCPKCGSRVIREATPMCAAWCDAARECLGAERYEQLVGSGKLDSVPDKVPED